MSKISFKAKALAVVAGGLVVLGFIGYWVVQFGYNRIYIPEGSECDPKWWNIGIRIEDDILVTNEGPDNLSKKAPRSIIEIEALMKEESSFE